MKTAEKLRWVYMKTALITGGAKRIGRGITESLAASGWRVFIHYNSSKTEADSLAANINSGGGAAEVIAANFEDASQVEKILPYITESAGSLDLLINSASSFLKDDADDFNAETLKRQLASNLVAPMILARDFARQKRKGLIINILDQKLWNMNPDFYSYTVAKYGLRGATEAMAMQFAPDIRVNAIAPGLILRSGKQTDAGFAVAHSQTPLKRGATIKDIINSMQIIIESEWMTGQTLFVDCGAHLYALPRDIALMVE